MYPHKKNQKKKTPEEHKLLLKKRYIIEHVFSRVKNYYRIMVRKDKLLITYMGFYFLASMLAPKKWVVIISYIVSGEPL